jgi:hypothetical protein
VQLGSRPEAVEEILRRIDYSPLFLPMRFPNFVDNKSAFFSLFRNARSGLDDYVVRIENPLFW